MSVQLPTIEPKFSSFSSRRKVHLAAAGVASLLLATTGTQFGMAEPAPMPNIVLVSTAVADADELIAQAQSQFQNRQYEEALTTLGQIDAASLTADQKSAMDNLSARITPAVAQRKGARASFEAGQQALASKDYVTALSHYQAVRFNMYADEGTRAKATEQIELARSEMSDAGISPRSVYSDAVREFKAGEYAAARPKFMALTAIGFNPGMFNTKPEKFLSDIDERIGPVTVESGVTEMPVDAPAPAVEETPEVMTQPAMDEAEAPAVAEVKVDKNAGMNAYDAGVAAYEANDLVGAKAHFQRAVELKFKPSFFRTSPEKFIERIDEKLAIDAQQTARDVRVAEETAAAETSAAEAMRDDSSAPDVSTDAPASDSNPMSDSSMPAEANQAGNTVSLDAAATEPAPESTPLQGTADAARLAQQQAAFEANLLVQRGDEARDARSYNAALNYYTQALAKDPSNTQAQAGVAAMQSMTGLGTGAANTATEFQQRVTAQQESIRYAFNLALEESRLAANNNEFDRARNALIKARSARDANPSIFGQADLANFDAQITAQETAIATAENAFLARAKEEERARQVVEQENQARLEAERKAEAIASLTQQAKLLGGQRKYTEALAIIKQIKAIDPENSYVIAAENLMWDAKQLQDQRNSIERFDRAVTDVFNQADEARIPIPDIMAYPEDWPDISVLRDKTVAAERGGVGDAATEAMLARVLPEMRFDQTAFQDVIEYLRDTTGANIFVNWNALEAAGVDRAAPITARLTNVTFRKVLDLVLRNADATGIGLDYTIDEGVITISTSEDLASNTQIQTYDIRDLLVDIPAFDNAPEFELETSGEGGGSPFGGGAGQQEDNPEAADLRVQEIMDIIQELVAPDTWKDAGGLQGEIRALGGQLIVTQSPEIQREVYDFLKKLREKRSIQVNVEARFITVQRNYLEEIGVDFDFQFNVDYANFPGTGFNPNSDFSPVLIEQNTVQQNTYGGFTAPGRLLTGVTGNLSDEAGTNKLGASTTISAFLDDFRAQLFIRAVQLGQYASTLTAPRLTLFNGQRAYVVVGTEQAYVSDLTPVVGSGAVGFDPEIDTVGSGVVLDVQATVSADRKYVTLTLRPSLRRLIALRAFATFTGGATGDENTDPSAFVGIIQQPEVQITQLQTTVSVPDRGTLLLGGQTLTGTVERESGVPVLSKIPFLKRLFTNRGTSKDEQVLLILVKPTIIIQREVEADSFPTLVQQ